MFKKFLRFLPWFAFLVAACTSTPPLTTFSLEVDTTDTYSVDSTVVDTASPDSPSTPVPASQLPVTAGDWNRLVIPWGYDGDPKFAWSPPPEMATKVPTTTTATVMVMPDDGMPGLLVGDVRHALTAYCQAGSSSFYECASQPPEVFTIDLIAWTEGLGPTEQHVLALNIDVPTDQNIQDYVNAKFAATEQHPPATTLVHYKVDNDGQWMVLDQHPVTTDTEATSLWFGDLDSDGWNDTIVTVAPPGQAVGYQGEPDGFTLAADGWTPPGSGRGGIILANIHPDGQREVISASFSNFTDGNPDAPTHSMTVCSLGLPFTWQVVPCDGEIESGSAYMGGTALGWDGTPGVGIILADVAEEDLYNDADGKLFDDSGWLGWEVGQSYGFERDIVHEEPYRTNWGIVARQLTGDGSVTVLQANSVDVDPVVENFPHPVTCYRIANGVWVRDTATQFQNVRESRGIVVGVELNGDRFPDTIFSSLYYDGGYLPSNGIQVVMGGKGSPSIPVDFRLANGQPAFETQVTTFANSGVVTTVLASSGGFVAHTPTATLFTSSDTLEIGVQWPDGTTDTYTAPFQAVIYH